MNENKSLISRENSIAIKGLLIILIIIGHNTFITNLFCEDNTPHYLYHTLYSFHIYGFFILPFLYGSKRIELPKTKAFKLLLVKNFSNLLWPYFVFFLILSVANIFINHKSFVFQEYLQSFITGDNHLLHETILIQIYWFLPAMFSFSILHFIYFNSSKFIKCLLFCLSLGIWIAFLFGGFANIKNVLSSISMFQCFTALLYLAIGVITREILSRKLSGFSWLIILLVFALSLFLRNWLIRSDSFDYIVTLSRFFLPISTFLLIYRYLSSLTRFKFINLCGKYSLQLFLFHDIIFYAYERVFSSYIESAIINCVVSLFVTILGSLFAIFVINKSNYLKKVIFLG